MSDGESERDRKADMLSAYPTTGPKYCIIAVLPDGTHRQTHKNTHTYAGTNTHTYKHTMHTHTHVHTH